jgi:HlyD family secretion protein
MMRSLVVLLALVGVGGGGAAWYLHEQAEQPSSFRTVPVERGDLQATIGSTATIEPEEVVDIGAQVAGMIKSFGKDPRDKSKDIDYGTPVDEGTVLAQIDDAIYKTQVDAAKATLDSNLALMAEAKTKLELSKRNWDRAKSLRKSNVMTEADYDSANADLQTSTPAVDAAKASVDQAQASLQQAKTNLKYTTIVAPVKGVIIDRRVNIGQTVVASLSAPSLFLIAKDLKRLQLWASVNEADIGQIHPEQTARFSVDAFPHKTFHGVVSQIRLNAVMTQNVVTYTVVVTTDNSSGQLLPYLTANVLFEVARKENVLMVPTAALRWRPQPAQVVADAREAFGKSSNRRGGTKEGAGGGGSSRRPEGADSSRRPEGADSSQHAEGAAASQSAEGAKAGQAGSARKQGRSKRELPSVWVEEDGFARPIQVQTGLTDGTDVEIVSGDLKEGTRVIIGEQRREEAAATTNPFLPSFFRGSKNQGKKD